MAQWDEFDLHNALVQYAKNNLISLAEDNCWRLTNLVNSTLDFSDMQWTHETVAAPDEATLLGLLATWQAAYDAQITTQQQEAAQADSARTNLQGLMQGLQGLSAEDKSYAIACRIMAHKDGATQQTILSIVDRATAVAYITSKPEWTGATAATRALVGDVLEMVAGITQVLLVVLTS